MRLISYIFMMSLFLSTPDHGIKRLTHDDSCVIVNNTDSPVMVWWDTGCCSDDSSGLQIKSFFIYRRHGRSDFMNLYQVLSDNNVHYTGNDFIYKIVRTEEQFHVHLRNESRKTSKRLLRKYIHVLRMDELTENPIFQDFPDGNIKQFNYSADTAWVYFPEKDLIPYPGKKLQ